MLRRPPRSTLLPSTSLLPSILNSRRALAAQQPRRVAALVALALAAPPLAHAYAKLGTTWPSGNIPLRLQLDSTANTVAFPLTDGSTTWNSVAESALGDWNAILSRSRFTSTISSAAAPTRAGDGTTQVFFATNYYGTAFDSRTLAVTLVDNGDQTIRTVEADLIVNKNRAWNSYRGTI
eukprot:gene47451-64329_t